ncbi:MAG: hypothetical protein V3U54_09055 [Thermodesulfobacteriota bacterium]
MNKDKLSRTDTKKFIVLSWLLEGGKLDAWIRRGIGIHEDLSLDTIFYRILKTGEGCIFEKGGQKKLAVNDPAARV